MCEIDGALGKPAESEIRENEFTSYLDREKLYMVFLTGSKRFRNSEFETWSVFSEHRRSVGR